MATIVNNPGTNSDGSNSMAMILGAVAIVLVLLLLLYYAVPAFNRNGNGMNNTPAAGESDTIINQENVVPPSDNTGDTNTDEMNINLPEVDVPENIDINVNEGQ